MLTTNPTSPPDGPPSEPLELDELPFFERARRVREALNLSEAELAKRLGIPAQAVVSWESEDASQALSAVRKRTVLAALQELHIATERLLAKPLMLAAGLGPFPFPLAMLGIHLMVRSMDKPPRGADSARTRLRVVLALDAAAQDAAANIAPFTPEQALHASLAAIDAALQVGLSLPELRHVLVQEASEA